MTFLHVFTGSWCSRYRKPKPQQIRSKTPYGITAWKVGITFTSILEAWPLVCLDTSSYSRKFKMVRFEELLNLLNSQETHQLCSPPLVPSAKTPQCAVAFRASPLFQRKRKGVWTPKKTSFLNCLRFRDRTWLQKKFVPTFPLWPESTNIWASPRALLFLVRCLTEPQNKDKDEHIWSGNRTVSKRGNR